MYSFGWHFYYHLEFGLLFRILPANCTVWRRLERKGVVDKRFLKASVCVRKSPSWVPSATAWQKLNEGSVLFEDWIYSPLDVMVISCSLSLFTSPPSLTQGHKIQNYRRPSLWGWSEICENRKGVLELKGRPRYGRGVANKSRDVTTYPPPLTTSL